MQWGQRYFAGNPDLNELSVLTQSKDLPQKTSEVMSFLEQAGPDILSRLAETYMPAPETAYAGWTICSPASAVFAEVLATNFSIPWGRGLTGEHLEVLERVYYDANLIVVHQNLNYADSAGNKFVIDPVYLLQFVTNLIPLDKALLVRNFTSETLELGLRTEMNLYDLNDFNPHYRSQIFGADDGRIPPEWFYESELEVHNDPALAMSPLVLWERDGHSRMLADENYLAEPIVNSYAPGWKSEQILSRQRQMKADIINYHRMRPLRLLTLGELLDTNPMRAITEVSNRFAVIGV